MKNVLFLILILITLYWLAVVVLYLKQTDLLFLKQPPNFDQYQRLESNPKVQVLRLKTPDDVTLQGWLSLPERALKEKVPVVIIFGGNADEASNYFSLDHFFLDHGRAIVAFNYRGYGLSEGMPSERRLIQDAQRIYDHIAQRPEIDEQNIMILGRSLGTGVAAQLAAQKQPKHLVLISPFDSMTNVVKEHFPWVLGIDWLLQHSFQSMAVVNNILSSTFIAYSQQDNTVSAHRTEALIEGFNEKPTVITLNEYDHNNIIAAPTLWKELQAFIMQ